MRENEALKRQIALGDYDPDNPVIIPQRKDVRYRSWREVKSPQTLFDAARLLRSHTDIAIDHIGRAEEDGWAQRARDTASEMVKTLRQVLSDDKPDLVIWQTGTVDAMLGVDPDEFQKTLGSGLDVLRTGNADAVFVNMQYSPRTDSMISLGAYLDAIRFVAVQREIPLFDRLGVMKDWNEMGVFDLSTATKKIDVAESRCGRLYLPIHAIEQAVAMDVEPDVLVPAH